MKRASSSAKPTMDLTLDVVLDLLATRIAEKVASARNDEAGGGAIYTSKSPPPCMTRKWFNEVCRQRFAQGDKSIRKVGRIWVAPAEAFEKRARLASPAKGHGGVWSAAAALESVDVRPTR